MELVGTLIVVGVLGTIVHTGMAQEVVLIEKIVAPATNDSFLFMYLSLCLITQTELNAIGVEVIE